MKAEAEAAEQRVPERHSIAGAEQVPSLGMMLFAFILTGLGTAMLGPLLPLLTRQWHLRDEQSGLLLLAQFCGSFLGGATISWRLKRGLLLGVSASSLGLFVFAISPGLSFACPALLLAGFGIGHSLTAVNILAGQRFSEKRASALSLLNFFWSFGAMLAPLLSGWLSPHVALPHLILALAVLFAICASGLALQMRTGFTESRPIEQVAEPGQRPGLLRTTFVFFMAMLFFYGGLETCLSGWLTTYAFRYGDKTLAISQYTTLLLWMSLTLGRIGSAGLLRKLPETFVWRLALLTTLLLTGCLMFAYTAATIALTAVCLGLSLSPWFPITLSLLMEQRPRARQAGIVIAVSGLGAAALPWLMGVLSTRSGSLQRALVVPVLATCVLLTLSLMRRATLAK